MNLTTNDNDQDKCMLSFGQPARISHADGYISFDENGQAGFYYYLQDHLGNVRSVITPDQNNQPTIVQANDYFPFGMSYSTAPNANKFKYNGKEEQEMPGKWLDYGFRFYDSHLARFHAVDPLAEVYSFQSPFAYATNNPVRYVDVFGLYAGEAGKWNSDDPEFEKVYAYWGGIGSSTAESKDDDSSSETDNASKSKSSGKSDPWGTIGAGYAQARTLGAEGHHAAMRGRDPFNPTKEDDDAVDQSFMTGIAVVVAIPGSGGAYIGKLTIKGGKYVITYAPRIYKSTLSAINSLKYMGTRAYIYAESSIIAQGVAGVGIGTAEAFFDLPPGGIDHPFLITHLTANFTNATIHFLEIDP